MQKEDGSMPWFPGLAGNAYLTREVGYLLARLGSANANARRVMTGIKRYLKASLEESIEKRKEYNKDWVPYLSDLRTLYVLTKDGAADKETLQLVKKVLKRCEYAVEGAVQNGDYSVQGVHVWVVGFA